MPITSTQQQDIIKLGVGMFNASVGGYVGELAGLIAPSTGVGMTTAQLYDALANSSAFKGLNFAYSSASTNAQFSAYFCAQVLGTSVSATNMTAASAYISSLLDGGQTRGAAIKAAVDYLSLTTTLTNTDFGDAAKQFVNKVTVATDYTINQSGASKDLAALQGTISTVTSTSTTVTAAIAGSNTSAAGQTFTLATITDAITGTSGNDTIVGDFGSGTVQASDQINGGSGTDTLKLFGAYAAANMPISATNIEILDFVNPTLGAAANLDGTAISGVTKVMIEQANTNGAAATITTGSGQTLQLGVASGTKAVAETWIASATDTTANLILNGFSDKGNTTTMTGALTTTLNITSQGASNTLTLAGPATVTKEVVTGANNLTMTDTVASKVKTFDASAATGKVSLDMTAAVTAASFAFTGGTGNDTLKVKAAEFGTLTAGSQLDGGAGTDTLTINDTGVLSATPSIYTGINAAKNFEVLGLGTTGATVDVSQLTSINKFSTAVATTTIQNATNTTTVAVDNSAGTTLLAIGDVAGNSTTTVTIDNGSGAAQTLAALTLTGINTLNLASTGVATKAGGTNTITALNNVENSSIVVTGDTDLIITALATNAVTTGSKVDASAFTGKLTITAATNKADILIGGSAADSLASGAAGATLTGGGGADTFKVGATVITAGGAAAPIFDTITDFTKGDKIDFLTNNITFVATKDAAASNASTLALAITAADSGATQYQVTWFQYGGNTYLVEDNAGNAAVQNTDVLVKLTGLVDLSTSTATGATTVLTFA